MRRHDSPQLDLYARFRATNPAMANQVWLNVEISHALVSVLVPYKSLYKVLRAIFCHNEESFGPIYCKM